jgi:pumilio family protein 6
MRKSHGNNALLTFSSSLESLPEIVHTKDGSAVVRELIIRGTAKDRKQILQQLKKHVEAMCKDADAQLVLFTAFDCVDDTKLMGKAFVTDVIALAPSLLEDGIGRRSVLYVLTPTASRHYMPSTLALLAKGAAQAKELGTSKKDAAVRRKELVTYGSEGLLQLVADKGADLLKDDGAALAIAELMLHTTGDKAAAIASLTAPLAAPFSGDGTHVLELAYAPRVYKTLLSGGHYNMKTKAINVLDPALGPAFAQAFWAAISSDDAGGAANAIRVAAAAPFVAVELLAALGAEGKDARAVLAEGKDEIAASEAKGAKVLLESLA